MFSIFQIAIGHHVEFLKVQNSICWWGLEDWGTSSWQILSKFVNQSLRYCDLSIFFNMASSAILFLKLRKFYLLSASRGADSITIRNLVKIGQSVVEILQFFDFSRWPLFLSSTTPKSHPCIRPRGLSNETQKSTGGLTYSVTQDCSFSFTFCYVYYSFQFFYLDPSFHISPIRHFITGTW